MQPATAARFEIRWEIAYTIPAHTQAMSLYALSAEAYASAALGEKVLSLLRIGRQTVLATEYSVEVGDGLADRLIADAAYGYGLVPILYQRKRTEDAQFFPSEDIRIEAGSRLVVLSTIDGVQNVEHGISAEKVFQVRLLHATSREAEFEGARTIARGTGCELGTARTEISHLPAILSIYLFRQQALRLIRELKVARVEAEVLSSRDAAFTC